ncbi:MAG: AbrB/MazE/SpoVT family DNA-binding domain-containing protein [Propionibacteriaceae bacterium]|nr:AbrB/MazE/SpoVT family DNA-binding domain-containing protein [Propionibacteriaceae bacterium]
MGDNVLTATISSKGQIVIPVQLRRQLGLSPGDTVVFQLGPDGQTVLRRRETWDELSARFHAWIEPGTPPLEDASGFYDSREPRL